MPSYHRSTRISSSGASSSSCVLLIRVLDGALRASILASAVCTGVWLGARQHALKGGSSSASNRNQPIRMRRTGCGGMEVVGDSNIPSGYTAGLTRTAGDSFAIPRANGPVASPPLEQGGGVAEVFGPDGRLTLRFSAIERPNGQWKMFEFRPPAGR